MSRNAPAQVQQAPQDVLAGIVERLTFHNDENGCRSGTRLPSTRLARSGAQQTPPVGGRGGTGQADLLLPRPRGENPRWLLHIHHDV